MHHSAGCCIALRTAVSLGIDRTLVIYIKPRSCHDPLSGRVQPNKYIWKRRLVFVRAASVVMVFGLGYDLAHFPPFFGVSGP